MKKIHGFSICSNATVIFSMSRFCTQAYRYQTKIKMNAFEQQMQMIHYNDNRIKHFDFIFLCIEFQ